MSDENGVQQLGVCSNCKRWKKACSIDWIRSRSKRKRPSRPQKDLQQVVNLSYEPAYDVGNESQGWVPNDVVSLHSDNSQDWTALVGFFGNPQNGGPPSLLSEMSSHSDISPAIMTDAGMHSSTQFAPALLNTTGQTGVERDDCEEDAHADVFDHFSHWQDGTALSERHSDFQGGTSLIQLPTQSHCGPSKAKLSSAMASAMLGRVASPFSSQLLSEEYNRLSIKKGLLKIYHDSMEGALSCWLTERNCPYSLSKFDGKEVWSSNWANRMVTRVCELDKVYTDAVKASQREQDQAGRVLNLVVMAFAAQWSQTGKRSESRLSDCFGNMDSMFDQLGDDVFGKDVQSRLWHQASKALGAAADNCSFRVIFAGIIFSLAQRPIDSSEDKQFHGLDSLPEILELDGAPVCLDVALRKLVDHRRKMEDGRSGYKAFSREHKETFGLLCWLAMMFDTLSAAVNRRSFAVCDADSDFSSECPHEAATCVQSEQPIVDLDGWSSPSESASSRSQSSSEVWGDYFMQQSSRSGDRRKQYVRWPCSYHDAASCLADAAPVKVLLFRRVAQLQSLSYRHAAAADIEKALEAAMHVYTHWNQSYGRFIEDCIQNHEELPARIQSWYILLAGHWNLAVMILSETVQKLDERGLTLSSNRRSRNAIGFTTALYNRAACAVSDLGRCSRYGDEDLTFSHSPAFHHAVNKAALLTEPWTAVLVRSFSYAGAFLTNQVSIANSAADGIAARERLQCCIEALWVLGKKSDMALYAAKVLLQAAT